jgi:hypothetical protein
MKHLLWTVAMSVKLAGVGLRLWLYVLALGLAVGCSSAPSALPCYTLVGVVQASSEIILFNRCTGHLSTRRLEQTLTPQALPQAHKVPL